MIVDVLINGLVSGGIYAVAALGFVLIYRASQVMNFAHGELLMVGAYLAMTGSLSLGLGYVGALAFAAIGTAIVAVIIERIVVARLASRSQTSMIIATLAVGVILAELVKIYWGTVIYPMPPPFAGQSIKIFDTAITLRDVSILMVSLVMTLALGAFLKFTQAGIALRAAAQNPTVARLLGIRVARVQILVWALSGAMAAIAGALIASVTSVSPSMNMIILSVFAAVVLGGMNSLPGAIGGGFILGILQTAVGFYVSSALINMLTFATLITVLLIRPQGLFGSKSGRRV